MVNVELAPVLHLESMLVGGTTSLAVFIGEKGVAGEFKALAFGSLNNDLEGRARRIGRGQNSSPAALQGIENELDDRLSSRNAIPLQGQLL